MLESYFNDFPLISSSGRGLSAKPRPVYFSVLGEEKSPISASGKHVPISDNSISETTSCISFSPIPGLSSFEKCAYMEDRIVPDERGGIIALNKKKYSAYDIYIGITSSSLVIAECEEHNYFYEFDDKPGMGEKDRHTPAQSTKFRQN